MSDRASLSSPEGRVLQYFIDQSPEGIMRVITVADQKGGAGNGHHRR